MIRAGLATILLLALLGCERVDPIEARASEHVSFHRDPRLSQTRRIAVLPLYRGSDADASSRALDEAMPAAWRDLGDFEVLGLDLETRQALLGPDPVLRNDIPAESLRLLWESFKVDAVLLGRIERFDGYDPIEVGLSAALVSCRDGTVLWSGGGHFDGSTTRIQQDIRAWWLSHRRGARESVSGWQQTLQSPRLFARYVSDRLAASARAPSETQPSHQTPRPPPR